MIARNVSKLFAILLLPFVARAAALPSAEDTRFFNEKVRPILETRCFECHSHQSGKMKNGLTLDSREGWSNGGDSGPAIVPGDADKSLLIRAIRHTDAELEMPPKRKLPDTEIAVLEEWVRRGAPDPRVTAVSSISAKLDWWSLKPLVRPTVPAGAANPVDAFIAVSLRNRSIAPAPEADRRTLIRRLYFDLIGLLPSPDEVDRFVRDDDPGAYEKLVDRTLASPRYGERWARHWLDTIHYADTHGFEHDLIRTNAWRYRDYVITSLNRDTPWPRFIREQLAADVFYPDQPALRVALGFIAAGPFDQSTAQTAPKTFDYMDRDDMVTQTMATFVSATVNCARCHDHKFDPITQEDYYALQAVFAGVGKGDVEFDEDPAVLRERQAWKQRLAAANATNASFLLASTNESLVAEWESKHGNQAKWETPRPDSFTSSNQTVLNLKDDGSILAGGHRPETDTYSVVVNPKGREVTAIRLEILSDTSLPKNGPGRQDNGNMHLSEFQVHLIDSNKAGNSAPSIVPIRRATADFNQSGWTISHALDGNEKTAWGIFPEVGVSHMAVFELETRLTLPDDTRLTFKLKQLHGGGHLIGKFRLSLTADDPAFATLLPANVADAQCVPREKRNDTQRLVLAEYALKAVANERLAAMPAAKVTFAAAPNFTAVAEGAFYKSWPKPKTVQVLRRGEIDKPGADAVPGAISAITTLPGRFELKDRNDEAARRAALAEWLAHSNNPLTWRSIVNRVWHYHFGKGISDSPNDLGRMGGLPTHPELLDWLACEFRDRGGSLKALHRLIVTSAAYRRSTKFSESAFAADPDNRLLWRRQTLRLDAESFRDEVLALADRLDLTMGGPGIKQFKLGKPIQLTPSVDYGAFKWESPGAARRSIYRFVFRGLQDPFMDVLDFPDAAQLAPTRPFSASALQALALLNDDFVLYHSMRLAERLERDASSAEQRVQTAFRLAFQRYPTEDETSEFAAYARRNGLPAMCRLLLNSNEFLFID